MNRYRTHMIVDLTEELVGEKILVSGWVENIRDHGGVLFLDLRDETGTLQTVSNDDDMFKGIAKESVVRLSGTIRKRDEGTENSRITTGTIELLVDELDILGPSLHELPFEIMTSKQTKDDVRLKYRYLDLRNEMVKNNIKLRAEILHFLRNKMYDLGFTEVQTPILTASSPEGARDFVVPSRLFKGKFYALPQAPQIYKELLMVGGMGKYFQIAPCFRDEDARADRTLEFYQLDLEMSFVEEEEVLNVGEEIFYDTFTKFSNKEVSPRPFRRIAYRDAIDLYGSDKPDLRFDMTIKDITEIFKNTEFTVFKNVIAASGVINAVVAKNAADKFSRKDIDTLTDFVKSKKASGLAYIKYNEEITGSVVKVLSELELKEIKEKLEIENNDIVFIVSGDYKTVKSALGALRLKLGESLNLLDPNKLELCIINDFPMFELDEETGKYDFCHNPFSLPHGGMEDYKTKNPEDILAYQYDFVCNGNEMASGAIRNHDLDSLAKGFEIVGYSREEVEERFKSIFTAFKYGCPPHGGMAPGIDRLIMLIQDEPNLREVQVFPPNASGMDLMMGSPSELTKEQFEELGITIKKKG